MKISTDLCTVACNWIFIEFISCVITKDSNKKKDKRKKKEKDKKINYNKERVWKKCINI